MKKASIFLLMVFLCCAVFLGGFFLGRQLDHSTVRVSNVSTSSIAPTQPKQESGGELLNINTATVEELSCLPTIGEVIAQRIVDYRQEHGPFRTVGELTAVEGIGEKRLDAILELITTGG